MKILYAVQATGNGHISRAMELLPYLENYGKVDLFLSGDNCSLELNAPIAYRSKGLSLYYNNGGGLDYLRMLRQTSFTRCFREARDLPVEKYDMVINDFEAITALACALKKIPSVQFGHQASFQSVNTPRPQKKDVFGEWILKNYARASHYIGLHFDRYDEQIFTPVIKKEIRDTTPENHGHITVYLSAFPSTALVPLLNLVPEVHFHLFSKDVKQTIRKQNVTLFPVQKEGFDKSLATCNGVVTGAGFETPAEALFLGKKLLTVPIRGQYEQYCNGAALEKMGIPVVMKVDQQFPGIIQQWLQSKQTANVDYSMRTASVVEQVFHTYPSGAVPLADWAPELNFN